MRKYFRKIMKHGMGKMRHTENRCARAAEAFVIALAVAIGIGMGLFVTAAVLGR